MRPWNLNLRLLGDLRNAAPTGQRGKALSLVAQLGDLAPNETGPPRPAAQRRYESEIFSQEGQKGRRLD